MSRRKSKKPTRRRKPPTQKTVATQQKSASPPEIKGQSNWRFAVLIALIVLPLVGFWVYVKWLGSSMTQNDGPADSNGDSKPKLTANQTHDPSNKNAILQSGTDSTQPANLGGSLTAEELAKAWQTAGSLTENWSKIDDPASDGWDTEIIAANVTKQLKKLQELMSRRDPIDAASVTDLVSDNASIKPLRPQQLVTKFGDEILRVQRGVDPKNDALDESARGADALASALRAITEPYIDREKIRAKLKVFRVEKLSDSIQTHQTIEMFGPTKQGLLEENGVWIAQWESTGPSNVPVLRSLSVAEYENVERFGGPLFTDCTESVLGHTKSFQKQLLQGYNHWLERSQFHRYLSILANPGVAIGDVNGDDLADVYVCQEAGLPNLLYLQNMDGTLSDQSEKSGADWLQNASTALIVDLDNDGHQDLVCAVTGGVVLARGDGKGHFSIVSVLDSADHLMALAAADYDRDGRLDLFVGAYFPDGVGVQTETIVPGSGGQLGEAGVGGRNSLYRNVSIAENWKFEDVTNDVGLNQNNLRYTLAASWEDFDNDGDQDLYVANDYGWNSLYRNDLDSDGKPVFVDIAEAAGAKDNAFGMSVAWSDYDRDGWMDLYISNMFSYAGNRIAFQNQFKSDSTDEEKRRFQRLARGNTLLRNLGHMAASDGRQFEDQSVQAAVNQGRWAWGSCFVDINNDSWDDLVVTNGYITTDDSGDL